MFASIRKIRIEQLLSITLIVIATLNLASRSATEQGFMIFFLVMLCIAFFGPKNQLRPKDIFRRYGIEIQFVIWILAILVSHLVNKNFNESEISELGEYRWMIGVYPLVAGLLITGVSRKGLNIFLFLMAALNIFFVASYFVNPPLPGVIGYPSRLTGFFTSPTDFAHALLFPFILSVCFLLAPEKNKSAKQWGFDLFVAATLALALLLSYTRSVQLACALGVLLLCLRLGRKYFVRILLFLSVFLVVTFSTNFLGMRDRIAFSLAPSKTYDSERITVTKGNWAIFLDNPIFGVGYHHNQHNLRPYYDKWGLPKDTLQAHAHNQILNLLAGTGFIGAGAYLLLMGTFLFFAWQNLKKTFKGSFGYELALSLFLILITFLIAGLTDTNFELLAPKYYVLFTWSLILYQKRTLAMPKELT